jgi:hypothetical protein
MYRLPAALIAASLAASVSASTPIYNANISPSEVLAAQTAWCDSLIAISTAGAEQGPAAARQLAAEVIDSAYGFNLGPVLFKPTLAAPPQTFRTTRDGAISYFVGGDGDFQGDSGFALKGWTACRAENAAIHINGDVATTMGNVIITDKDGNVTTVDKTWAFKKDDAGTLRIVVHHSSLPFSAP